MHENELESEMKERAKRNYHNFFFVPYLCRMFNNNIAATAAVM
jgi:hypothetical protein